MLGQLDGADRQGKIGMSWGTAAARCWGGGKRIETLFEIIGVINSIVWGPWMMVLVLGTGLWLSIGTGFIQFRKFGHAVRLMIQGARRKDTAELGPGRG